MLIKDSVTNSTAVDTFDVDTSRALFIQRYLESPWKKVLYLHIPFCPSKCRYCICETRVCSDAEQLHAFVYTTLVRQIEQYRPALENTRFDQLYIGGGTPTILDAALLREIFNRIPNLRNIPIKCVECSPNTLTFEHLELFTEYSFTFISMGVQSLQKNICKWQNRYHVTADEIVGISRVLAETGIYFNYDMICYLGKGDIRDIPAFEEDMLFLMQQCKPSSICVHQHHQIEFSCEKTRCLQNVLRNLVESPDLDYECINSLLLEEDITRDTMYQAQYRLVRERRDFCHYMWKRYPMVPVRGYDVLGLGFMDRIHVKSNVGDLIFAESRNQFTKVVYQDFVYDDFKQVRQIKGLAIQNNL